MSRRFIFKHYWWMALLAGLTGIALVVRATDDGRVSLVGSVVAGILAFCYFAQTQKLQEMSLFKELFTDFNERYDRLNDPLADIVAQGEASDAGTRAVIVDYFNLCAEEYLWYSEGYIPDAVWQSWCAGMLSYLDREPFRSMWAKEVATRSYYGLSLDTIRKGAG